MKRIIVLFIVVLFILSSIVQLSTAEDYKKINVDKLKEIEGQDSFPVKIINKQVIIDGSEPPAVLDDRLCLTLSNKDILPVKDFTVYLVAYDEELSPLEVGLGTIEYPYIQTLKNTQYSYPKKDFCIAANADEAFNMDCKGKKIAGIRAIVASYITTDDVLHENPLAEEWTNNVTGSRIIQLD